MANAHCFSMSSDWLIHMFSRVPLVYTGKSSLP